MLRADARVVESRTDRVSQPDLPLIGLQKIAERAVKDPWCSFGQGCRRLAGLHTQAGRLDTDHSDVVIVQERVKHTNGIGTATHACDQIIRIASFPMMNLTSGFFSDHPL